MSRFLVPDWVTPFLPILPHMLFKCINFVDCHWNLQSLSRIP